MALDTTAAIRNEDRGSAVGWGAIFAAGFIAAALEIMFVLLAAAISFSALNPQNGVSWSNTATVWEAIYLLVTSIISFYVGGYAAGRLCGLKLRGSAMLHGLAAWGLVLVFTSFVFGSAIGNVVGGALQLTGTTAAATISSAGRVASGIAQNPKATGRLQSKQAQSRIKSEAGQVSKNIQQNVNVKAAAGKLTNAIAGGSWFAFILAICTGIFAVIGAAVGCRSPRSERREGLRAA